MERAAEDLETKFKATEKKLDKVSWRVDQLTGVPDKGTETLSTAKLLATFQEVKSDFRSVVEEVQQLKMDQQTAMSSILNELNTTCNSMETLKGQLNLPKE